MPLKNSVSAAMETLQSNFEKKRAAYEMKLESWTKAQAEQKPGEEVRRNYNFFCLYQFLVAVSTYFRRFFNRTGIS